MPAIHTNKIITPGAKSSLRFIRNPQGVIILQLELKHEVQRPQGEGHPPMTHTRVGRVNRVASLHSLKAALYGLPVPLEPPCYSPDISIISSKAIFTSLEGGAGVGGSWEISVHSP